MKACFRRYPTESEEQIALFEWAALQTGAHPELKLLYHVPNGGYRHAATAARLSAEGVKPGVPDICLPVPRGKYHGLYIELKRQVDWKIEPEQEQWLTALARNGYCAMVCFGAQDAIDAILDYLEANHAETN